MTTLTWDTTTVGTMHWTVPEDEVAERLAQLRALGYEVTITRAYMFDVFTASHDDVKVGRLDTVRSRVVIEADTYASAQDTAAALAVAVHGGMATAALVRY